MVRTLSGMEKALDKMVPRLHGQRRRQERLEAFWERRVAELRSPGALLVLMRSNAYTLTTKSWSSGREKTIETE